MTIPAISPYSLPSAPELPKNRVSWKADPQRAVLLVHDMQQYFLNAYTPGVSPLVELLENIRLLKRQCAQRGAPVVHTAQPGGQKAGERGLLQDFWGAGLPDDPGQTRLVAGIEPGEDDTVLTKWRYSAFKRTRLGEFIQNQGRDQLIICGVYAHIGCLLTACDAFMQDMETFLVGDAMADFSAEHHRMALGYAADNCAAVIATTQLLREWQSGLPAANTALSAAGRSQLPTLRLMRQQVAELLGETEVDIDDNENLIDRGLDSIRMMSLVEKWRGTGFNLTFVKLAKKPTLSAWRELLEASE
jgi:bifunctional isochorismate lyase/aryl carrier protein